MSQHGLFTIYEEEVDISWIIDMLDSDTDRNSESKIEVIPSEIELTSAYSSVEGIQEVSTSSYFNCFYSPFSDSTSKNSLTSYFSTTKIANSASTGVQPKLLAKNSDSLALAAQVYDSKLERMLPYSTLPTHKAVFYTGSPLFRMETKRKRFYSFNNLGSISRNDELSLKQCQSSGLFPRCSYKNIMAFPKLSSKNPRTLSAPSELSKSSHRSGDHWHNISQSNPSLPAFFKTPLIEPAEIQEYSSALWSTWQSMLGSKFDTWSTREKDIPSQLFVTYQSIPTQLCGTGLFFIEAKTEINLFQPHDFHTIIQSPNGLVCPFRIQRDINHPKRFIISFVATVPGNYFVNIEVRNPEFQPIVGSPFNLLISRDYTLRPQQSLVRFGFHNTRIPNTKSSHITKVNIAWGIASNNYTDQIYVADRGENRVLIYDSDGRLLHRFGTFGNQAGQLHCPTGIACDLMNNRIIVSDKDNHRICFYTFDGVFVASIGKRGKGNGQFCYPWGVAASPDGSLIAVADSWNHRLQLFDRKGRFLRKYDVYAYNPLTNQYEFDCPRGITFDNEGQNMYVTDFNELTVLKVDVNCNKKQLMSHEKIVQLPDNISQPRGITVDHAGNIIICDARKNCLHIADSNGTIITSLYRTGRDQFHIPQDVTVLRGGFVAVVEANSEIRIV